MSNLLTTMMNMPQQLTAADLQSLAGARQIYSDCYMVSSLNSLTRTEKGKALLRSHIRKVNTPERQGFVIHYSNVNNQQRDVFVSEKEIKEMNTSTAKLLKNCKETEDNDILKAIELSMHKLIKENPSLKNIISRLNPCLENFENNLPSNFMKMFLGKDTINVNLKTPLPTLSFSKNKTRKLLEQIEKADKNHHFVACTSYTKSPHFKVWHCYTILSVDTEKNAINLYEPRQAKEMCVDIDYFMKNFKFISGYFEE